MLPDKAQFYVNIFRIVLPNLIKNKTREIQEKQTLTTLSIFITLQSVIYALATRLCQRFKAIVTYLTKILNMLFQCYS